MTPVDESVLAAIGRVDVGWLSTHLDAEACSPTVLGALIRHDEPRLRHLGLVRLAERATEGRIGDEAALAELAGRLPTSLDGPPETALVLAELYRRLRPYVRGRHRPQWRAADLPARVRMAWLRTEILDRPTTIRDEPAGELLYQAVHQIGAADADEPEPLIRELTGSRDPVLQAAALRVTRDALYGGLLAPARARAHVAELAGAADQDTAIAALRELAEPWAALDRLPLERLRPFLSAGSAAGPAVADAALAAAAGHGHRSVLWDVVADQEMPPALRRRALELLGDLADRDDIHELTNIAAEDPLLFGGPAVACLRRLHRRGHFPDGADAPAIVDLALADHTISPCEIATILYTCRHEMFRALVEVAADEPTWPRRLRLLVALAGQGTEEVPIGDAITDVLPAAPSPEPFLNAIRVLRHTAAEDAVITALPRAPAAALGALEAVGGWRTVTALKEGLGLTGQHGTDSAAGAVAPCLRPVRHRALELLWQLTDDPRQRQAILVRLDPRDLPGRIAADLGGPDERELAVLSSNLDPDKPVEALRRLARGGGAGTVPAIAGLLLRIVSDLATSWEPDGPARPVGTRQSDDGRPGGEPAVPQEVVDAVRDLGGRLQERGRIRPLCLLDAANAREAGDALVATVALDLLDRPEPSGAERAILLGLLVQVRYPRTRARVHRLVRHRDRHVRKHAIALLARDAAGDDAQALSASLISLTTARDVRTVRQALLALGHARARWACPAIAACLDHPTMNVKKTAAGVLVRAGTPAAVPKLLFWLGDHDNPGLRATLIEALRAILGDAYAATVLAAADQAGDHRGRTLLLEGLGGALSARAVGALVDQGSPVGPALLALVAAGRVALGSGTIDELTAALAAHGIAAPAGRRSPAGRPPDADIGSLTAGGWNTRVAKRLADRHEQDPRQLTPDELIGLRPMLAHWLDLAGAEPARSAPILRLTLRLCPAPWAADEIETFTRSAQVLVTGLSGAGGEHRDDLIAILETVAPRLPPAEALGVVARIRALRPAPAGSRSPLTLLRRCGAVLTRADVELALAAARLGPSRWLAEAGVLRDAFEVAKPPEHAETGEWRTALEAAARTPEALREFRDHDERTVDSRDRLRALIDVYPSAGPDTRDALLDWMVALQPIDAPAWTIAENARRPVAATRTPRADDLDQPRSAALRERLLAMLNAPDASRRHTAALALRDWPEPETRVAVFRAFLQGRVDLRIDPYLARALNDIDEADLRAGDAAVHERASSAAAHLDPSDLERLIPLLLEWWEHGEPATRASAERALRQVPPDTMAEMLSDRLEAGAWGFLDLIAGARLLRTAALTEACRRLRADGRDDLAGALVLVEGPLRHADAVRQDAEALSALRGRQRRPPTSATPGPSRQELLELARTGPTGQIHRALSLLAEPYDDGPDDAGRGMARDPELESLLTELLGHPVTAIRLHAHRISRKVLDRPAYLHHTCVLLNDPQPDVVRSAIRTLCHAAWVPAIPAVVGLLAHPRPAVRTAAADGLVLVGMPAKSALTYAADHARPDKRHLYATVLEKITDANRTT